MSSAREISTEARFPPKGYAACRIHDGEQNLLALGARRQVTHLVALDKKGSNGGRPTVCGLTRFDERSATYEIVRRADLPSWSMGGGVYGSNIEQVECAQCWVVATSTEVAPNEHH